MTEGNKWAVGLHLSQLLSTSGLGIVVPIAIWLMKKDEIPEVDAHGRVVMNWLLSALVYLVVAVPLILLLGLGLLILWALPILNLIFPIIGAIKAADGKVWKYPGTISFL